MQSLYLFSAGDKGYLSFKIHSHLLLCHIDCMSDICYQKPNKNGYCKLTHLYAQTTPIADHLRGAYDGFIA